MELICELSFYQDQSLFIFVSIFIQFVVLRFRFVLEISDGRLNCVIAIFFRNKLI
jgi:hypothetical protein